MIANIASLLLEHYRLHARQLPWRATAGERPDPYRVWLSEVMLQQTTVATVTPRFARFVERWPTIETLAAARDEDVLGEWAGLGYYARARNLIACAREVSGRGGFPADEAQLRTLPGVGDYTAAAVAAIAFGQRAIVIDTNVERVVARLFAIERSVDEAGPQIRALADLITPQENAGDFAQAVMDLGATICRPRAPRCTDCPLRSECGAFASGEPERFPAAKAKRDRPHRTGTAWWTERDGCIWLVRRPKKGLLGGMAALPGDDWGSPPTPAQALAPPLAPPLAPALARVSHGFTHFTLDLSVRARAEPFGEGWWQPLEAIAQAGLPTLYRKAIAAVLAQRSDLFAA